MHFTFLRLLFELFFLSPSASIALSRATDSDHSTLWYSTDHLTLLTIFWSWRILRRPCYSFWWNSNWMKFKKSPEIGSDPLSKAFLALTDIFDLTQFLNESTHCMCNMLSFLVEQWFRSFSLSHLLCQIPNLWKPCALMLTCRRLGAFGKNLNWKSPNSRCTSVYWITSMLFPLLEQCISLTQ